MWTKAELEYLNDREYRFDSNPYKYGLKKPREVKTIDQVYSEYPRLRDRLEGKGKGKVKKTKRKNKGER